MPAAPRVRSALSRSLDRALVLVALLAAMLVVVELALLPLAGPAGPLLLMLLGLVVMVHRIRRRRTDAAPLSREEHEAAVRLLSGGGPER